jgi:glycosyltransferase involved in cell wall biosynthesis
VPGNGSGGPWRYVHSILAGIDLDEFDVVLFCDLPNGYAARPAVRVVRLEGDSNPVPEAADRNVGPTAQPVGQTFLSALSLTNGWRHLTPDFIRLWAGFGKEAARLARRFRMQPLDLLHTNNTGCEEAAVAARLARVPNVLGTFHVDPTYDLQQVRSQARHRLLECLSNHCLDRGIAVSEATRRTWLRRTHLPAERVGTIHNGIDPMKFRRRHTRPEARQRLGLRADAGPVIGGVGRLDEAKGFHYLLEAVAALSAEHPRLTLLLAGEGPLRSSLAESAGKLGIADRVHFLGFCQEVQVIYDALDVFVLPSLAETLGYAHLEAMATELPAIGTQVGGVPEVIRSGETGFLVPPRNSAALAAALRPLLSSAELCERMGRAGRRRVIESFHEADMVSRTIEVYRAMLGHRRRSFTARQIRDSVVSGRYAYASYASAR